MIKINSKILSIQILTLILILGLTNLRADNPVLFSDDFNRLNSDTVDNGWEEIPLEGSSIINEKLVLRRVQDSVFPSQFGSITRTVSTANNDLILSSQIEATGDIPGISYIELSFVHTVTPATPPLSNGKINKASLRFRPKTTSSSFGNPNTLEIRISILGNNTTLFAEAPANIDLKTKVYNFEFEVITQPGNNDCYQGFIYEIGTARPTTPSIKLTAPDLGLIDKIGVLGLSTDNSTRYVVDNVTLTATSTAPEVFINNFPNLPDPQTVIVIRDCDGVNLNNSSFETNRGIDITTFKMCVNGVDVTDLITLLLNNTQTPLGVHVSQIDDTALTLTIFYNLTSNLFFNLSKQHFEVSISDFSGATGSAASAP